MIDDKQMEAAEKAFIKKHGYMSYEDWAMTWMEGYQESEAKADKLAGAVDVLLSDDLNDYENFSKLRKALSEYRGEK